MPINLEHLIGFQKIHDNTSNCLFAIEVAYYSYLSKSTGAGKFSSIGICGRGIYPTRQAYI